LVYRSQSKYNILGDKCLKYFKVISWEDCRSRI
jgi:hypothetical protein